MGKKRGLRRYAALGVLAGLCGSALWMGGMLLSLAGPRTTEWKETVAWWGAAYQLGCWNTEEEGWQPKLLRAQLPWVRWEKEPVPTEREEQGPVRAEQELQDSDDMKKPELAEEDRGQPVLEMTARGKESGSYLWGQGVCAYNRTQQDLTEEILSEGSVKVDWSGGGRILIIHTHGSEAYARYDGDHYEESDPYRTTDCTHNIVRVGEEMANVFRGYGFQVLHDENLYDFPNYNGSYDRSKYAVERWLEKYPDIRVILDVHRDALTGKNGEIYKLVSTEAGEKVAQVMLVVGTEDAGLSHPGWRDNLALAVYLQQNLVRGYEDLARPIVLRSHRYNQQLLPGYLLVEVGGHGNTLGEALAGARLWADNVARSLLKLK